MSLFASRMGTAQRLVWAMALFYWPGTFVHELAHLLVGRLLLVKTYGLRLWPKAYADHIEYGHVMVPKVDHLRMFLIALAPVWVGLALIFALMWAADSYGLWQSWVWRIIIGFALFQIANSMFASSADMAAAMRLVVVVGLLFGLAYWLGWRPDWGWIGSVVLDHQDLIRQATIWLWPTVWIDVALLALLNLQPMLNTVWTASRR
jgi:hypothetical protein